MNKKNTSNFIPKKNVNSNANVTNKDAEKKPYQLAINIATIITLVFVSYFFSFNNEYNLDDNYILDALPKTEDGLVGAFSVFTKSYNFTDYRPIVTFSYAIEQLLFGLNPHTAHFINIVLFLLLCLSIYYVLSKIPSPNIHLISFAATLLFCVHTSHTEVVCSIKNRDNILSMLFGIWSLHFIIKSVLIKQKWFIALGVFLLFIGFLSKLDIISFVLIIPLTLILFYEINFKKIVLIIAVLFSAGLLRGNLLKDIVKDVPISYGVSFTENPLIANPTFINKISQAIQSVSYYIKFMLLPNNYYYYFGYDMIPLKSFFSLEIIGLLILNIGLLFFALYHFKRNKLITYGILFFYVAILYALNIAEFVSGIVAIRYSFIASLGFCIVLSSLLFLLSKKLMEQENLIKNPIYNKISPHLFKVLICISVFYYLPFTINRSKDWKDIFSIIRSDISDMKNSFQGNRIAASYVLHEAVYEKDSTQKQLLFKQGLLYALNAQNLYNKENYVNEMVAQAYYNLKNISYAKKKFQENIRYNDTSTVSLEYLGNIYFENEQNFDSAAYYYKKIIDLHPTYETAYFKYLNASYKAGKKTEILDFYNTLYNDTKTSYVPAQCLAYYYFFEKDSAIGMNYFKESFKLGFSNPDAAIFVQQYYLQHNNKDEANDMNQFIQKGL